MDSNRIFLLQKLTKEVSKIQHTATATSIKVLMRSLVEYSLDTCMCVFHCIVHVQFALYNHIYNI